MERTVVVEQYVCRIDVGDDVDDQTLELFKRICVDGWRRMVRAASFQPFGEPKAEVVHRVIPESFEDEETGEWFKMPDRAIYVRGRVVPLGTPISDDFDLDTIPVTLPS